MAYKNYKIRDNWLDIDKYNDVDIQSVDGVISSVKVNGEDYGGGGSSDFTTAKVIFTIEDSITEDFHINIINVYGEDMFDGLDSVDIDPEGNDAVLYKGKALVYVLQSYGVKVKEVSGDATKLDNFRVNITGDCAITFSIASI